MKSLSLPHALVDAWKSGIISRGRAGRDFSKILHRNEQSLHTLWAAYNTERSLIGRLPLSSERMVLPYLMGFHLNNLARAWMVLSRAEERQTIDRKKVGGLSGARIIDLGCGSGAGAQAVASWLNAMGLTSDKLEIELLDRSRHLVDAASEILNHAFSPKAKIRTLKKPLESPEARQILRKIADRSDTGLSVFTMGYIWNEIERNRPAMELMNDLFQQLVSAPPTLLLVLEPAAERPARAAVRLRDQLQALRWSPLYPCPHSRPCPLSQRPKDWCYSEVAVSMPDEQRMIDRALRLKRTILGVSGYLFANPAALETGLVRAPGAETQVLIGEPSEGRNVSWLVCNNQGIDKRPPNKANPGALRGDSVKK